MNNLFLKYFLFQCNEGLTLRKWPTLCPLSENKLVVSNGIFTKAPGNIKDPKISELIQERFGGFYMKQNPATERKREAFPREEFNHNKCNDVTS